MPCWKWALGSFGLIVLFVIPLVNYVYVAERGAWNAEHSAARCVAAVCLLPPTLADGGDAAGDCPVGPIDARRAFRGWGFFYGGNIAGAVFGCLLAGFYLLRVYDMSIATYVAVVINVGRGGASALLAARVQRDVGQTEAIRRVET